MKTELHLGSPGNTYVITDLTNTTFSVPQCVSDITCVNSEGVVPCVQQPVTMTVITDDGSAHSGIKRTLNPQIAEIDVGDSTVVFRNYTQAVVPTVSSWTVDEHTGVLVNGSVSNVNWHPKYILTVDSNTGQAVQLALCAVINNRSAKFKVDKLVLETKNYTARCEETSRLIEQCNRPGGIQVELQGESLEKCMNRGESLNALTAPGRSTISKYKMDGCTFVIDSPINIGPSQVIKLWSRSDSAQLQYTYGHNWSHVNNGYVFQVDPSTSPNGYVDVYTTNRVCLVKNRSVTVTQNGTLEIDLGPCKQITVTKIQEPRSLFSVSKSSSVSFKSTFTYPINVNWFPYDNPTDEVKMFAVNPGVNVQSHF